MNLSKISLKYLIFFISIAGIIFSSALSSSFHKYNTEIVLSNAPESESIGLPILLKIPKLNINTTIEQVGLASDGAMDVPKGPAEVAWFSPGSRPGEVGSAVIAGHSGYKDNRPAVFDNLYKLRKGDKIYIEDGKGAIITFIVRKIQIYNPKANAGEVFGSNDEMAHLNLVTCTGIWNKINKTHSDRLVIFSDKEIE
jgi:LPXTG-site transpeptidase (sortase) family protein